MFANPGNILLSFFLVTVIGGAFTSYLQQRRDKVTRLEANLSAIREVSSGGFSARTFSKKPGNKRTRAAVPRANNPASRVRGCKNAPRK